MGASLGRRCPTSGCGLGQVRPRWKLSSSVGRGRPTWDAMVWGMGALVGGAGVP